MYIDHENNKTVRGYLKGSAVIRTAQVYFNKKSIKYFVILLQYVVVSF